MSQDNAWSELSKGKGDEYGEFDEISMLTLDRVVVIGEDARIRG